MSTCQRWHIGSVWPACHWDKLSCITVYPEDIATEIAQPDLPDLIQQFMYNQQHHGSHSESNTSVSDLPIFYGKITVHPSAIAMFHAPSDISGIGSMCCEHIHTVKSWRKGPGHYNTIFVNTNPSMEGMQGLDIAHVRLFFYSLMTVSNIPVLSYIGSHTWATYQTITQACG